MPIIEYFGRLHGLFQWLLRQANIKWSNLTTMNLRKIILIQSLWFFAKRRLTQSNHYGLNDETFLIHLKECKFIQNFERISS